MKKARSIALFMVVLAVVLHYTFENDGIDFIIGFLAGGGVALLITGTFARKKRA
ncbi:hypothetical protein [Flavobacterium sp. SM2513]|uniref:hypothetical protein n=1 Tax=Flavobacterium sp. SM2513 TaxID=3424766 RepID=UPI003D7F69FF